MIHSIISILVLLTITLATYGVGRPIVRALRTAEDDRLTAHVWSLAVGLVVWGTVLAMLGQLGFLYRPAIVVATLVAALWGLGEAVFAWLTAVHARDTGSLISPESIASDGSRSGPPSWLSRGLLALAAVAAVGSLVGALAPPTAGDALCYHLELPKRFLDAGRFVYLPYHDNSTFPLIVEMWYLWAMALDGAVGAQLVHWGVGVLFALATVVLARPILGRGWSTLAGAVVLLTPGVTNQMTAPMNDVALALFTTLWLAAWWRAVVNQEGMRWFLLAGLAAGGAMATKYLALAFALAIAVSWLWTLWRKPARRRSLVLGMTVVATVAAGTSMLWYARAAYYRGNPVYPFFCDLQGAGPLGAQLKETLPEGKSPLGRGPAGLLSVPWQATMRPDLLGDRGHQLGVLFLAALPGLCLCRRLRGLGTLLAVALVYVFAWYGLRQYVRFLFPIVPMLCVALVWVWMEMRRFPHSALRCAVVVQAVVLVVFSLHAVHRSRDTWRVAVGLQSRNDYLAQHEPTYAIASLSNMLLGPNDRLLTQECRMFYFDRPTTQETVFRRAMAAGGSVDGSQDFAVQLRQARFTHVLLVDEVDCDDMPDAYRLNPSEEALDLVHVVHCTARDPDGHRCCYRLMKLR